MLVIVDYRAPIEAIEHLNRYGNVTLFNASGLTYDAVNGHPDIFIYQADNKLIIAPNTPSYIVSELDSRSIEYAIGSRPVDSTLAGSSQYNVISNSRYTLHKPGFTDSKILECTHELESISLPQSYTRCSMFLLDSRTAITSDGGIYSALSQSSLDIDCHLFSPNGIQLPPYKNGFLGGCLGRVGDDIVIMGSLDHLEEGEALRTLIKSKGLNTIELYRGPLYDCGGLFFIS